MFLSKKKIRYTLLLLLGSATTTQAISTPSWLTTLTLVALTSVEPTEGNTFKIIENNQTNFGVAALENHTCTLSYNNRGNYLSCWQPDSSTDRDIIFLGDHNKTFSFVEAPLNNLAGLDELALIEYRYNDLYNTSYMTAFGNFSIIYPHRTTNNRQTLALDSNTASVGNFGSFHLDGNLVLYGYHYYPNNPFEPPYSHIYNTNNTYGHTLIDNNFDFTILDKCVPQNLATSQIACIGNAVDLNTEEVFPVIFSSHTNNEEGGITNHTYYFDNTGTLDDLHSNLTNNHVYSLYTSDRFGIQSVYDLDQGNIETTSGPSDFFINKMKRYQHYDLFIGSRRSGGNAAFSQFDRGACNTKVPGRLCDVTVYHIEELITNLTHFAINNAAGRVDIISPEIVIHWWPETGKVNCTNYTIIKTTSQLVVFEAEQINRVNDYFVDIHNIYRSQTPAPYTVTTEETPLCPSNILYTQPPTSFIDFTTSQSPKSTQKNKQKWRKKKYILFAAYSLLGLTGILPITLYIWERNTKAKKSLKRAMNSPTSPIGSSVVGRNNRSPNGLSNQDSLNIFANKNLTTIELQELGPSPTTTNIALTTPSLLPVASYN